MNAVALADVSMFFGANRVLDRLSLTIGSGVLALMGANGAGKSTLIKILSGVYPGYGGVISVDGEPVNIDSPQVARSLGIETVHQKIGDCVVPGLTVAENLVLEDLTQRDFGSFFSVARILPGAREMAALLGLDWDNWMLRRDVFDLGVADQQLLLLARALARRPRLLILDEPTSALSIPEVKQLFGVLQRLRDAGVAILYVSHRLGEVDTLADRLVVLRDGRISLDQSRPFSWTEALHAMLGAQVDLKQGTVDERRGARGRLQLAGVRLRPACLPQDLDFRSGEVTGVVGLLGAGKSELVRGIFGAQAFSAGSMLLDGRGFAPRSPGDAIRSGVFLVPEDRAAEALLPGWSISRNVSVPFLQLVARLGVLNGRTEAALGQRVIEQLGVVCADGQGSNIDELSGGNQQRVVVGRWLVEQPRVLLLDEPFTGVDIGARGAIGRKLRTISAAGAAVVVVSADVDEILEVADRVLVLADGVIRLDAYITEIDRNRIVERMSEVA